MVALFDRGRDQSSSIALFRRSRSRAPLTSGTDTGVSNAALAKAAIPLGSYRAQKPTKAGNPKKIRKNYKIPHPELGPENTEKLPRKYKNGPKMTIFVFFWYFFRIFGARLRVGDFVIFFLIFFVFPVLGGFRTLYEPDGIAKQMPFSY